MAVLDFKEIPKAHKASGLQDTFELFARDFLSFIGYKILTDPIVAQTVESNRLTRINCLLRS